MHQIEFWFDFASSYSYLSAMRIRKIAQKAGVTVLWKPFLLGPIFNAQGWHTSPFNLYAAKGKYMMRDMERICVERGLDFTLPDPFPLNGLHAARISLVGHNEPWEKDFARAALLAEFAEGRDIADLHVLEEILDGLGLDSVRIIAASQTSANKTALRTRTNDAIRRDIFGAPTFITDDGELFWGDDRLEQALVWNPQGIPAL